MIEGGLLRAVVANVVIGELDQLGKRIKKEMEEMYGPVWGGGSCLMYLPRNEARDPSWRWPRK